MPSPKSPASGRRLEGTLGLVALALLLLGCVVVLKPFFNVILWASVLSFSTWPIHQRSLAICRGRRSLAAAITSLGLIVVLLLPFGVIGARLADSARELASATRAWLDEGPPNPPAWLGRVPVVGPSVTESWREMAADSARMIEEAKRLLEQIGPYVVSAGLKLGRGLMEIAASIFVAFFLFRDGVRVSEALRTGVARLAGERGQRLLDVAGKTIRGVVYGILGTALVQAVIAGVGFAMAGVPGAGLLALLTFFLSVVPAGPPLVWGPAALWLFQHGDTGWGIFMLIWGVGVSSVDNFVRPWLISQGSTMPFILIFFGVLGGMLAFGFLGVFLGPTLLAVGYRLVTEWASLRAESDDVELSPPLPTLPPRP